VKKYSIDFRKVMHRDVNWVVVSQDLVQWRAFVNLALEAK
jgi:hypothetical protein